MLSELRIGRISHAVDANGKTTWLWSLTGPHCDSLPADTKMCGEAMTLAEAKLQLRHAFDGWLRWALEQEGQVHWHWTEAAPDRKSTETHNGGLALAS